MARMRYVKPEYWTDSKIVHLTRDARLFYIGTWNFAICDRGHLEDDVLRLKMQIFPADSIDVAALLEELIGSGRIVREQLGEESWLRIVNLGAHQKVDPRWSPRCPACKAEQSTPPTSPDHTETHRNSPEALTSGNTAPRVSEPVHRAEYPEPLLNSPQEGIGGEGIGGRKTRPSAAPPDTFDEWWAAWPRKEAKAKAQAAYTKALKVVAADKLLRLTAEWFETRPDLQPQFIPLPASWLNARRWEDEPPPRTTFGTAPSPWDRTYRRGDEDL